MRLIDPPPDTLARLQGHRTVGRAPQRELEWLVQHGKLRSFEPGEHVLRKGQVIADSPLGLEIILSGHFAIYVDRGGGPRKVMEWQGGDVSGVLPFSRMRASIGDSITDATVESLSLPRGCLPDLVRECPAVTEIFVHVMLDRARIFNTSEWQDEKMASLGKLSAGLAHELNNPASAVVRSARQLLRSMEEADRAARQLAAARLTEMQLAAVDQLREKCVNPEGALLLSPLERAEREDEIADWLKAHGADSSAVSMLADTSVKIAALDELARELGGSELDAALDWVAAGCAVRNLARENDRAGSRISELVGAMKRLTHMDRALVQEPIDITPHLNDTLAILLHKARDKQASVKLDVAPDMPRVRVIGGELNQVWMNLIDNALDAVDTGGEVVIIAKPEGRSLVVRVIDNGPGIPLEIQPRIFDPFFTTKAPGKGTGMGLEVARMRARGNGGDIEFDSRPGRTEFRVTLPLAEEQGPVGTVP